MLNKSGATAMISVRRTLFVKGVEVGPERQGNAIQENSTLVGKHLSAQLATTAWELEAINAEDAQSGRLSIASSPMQIPKQNVVG